MQPHQMRHELLSKRTSILTNVKGPPLPPLGFYRSTPPGIWFEIQGSKAIGE